METRDQIPFWLRTANGIAFSEIPQREGGQLPHFAIVGAAKAGTTALNRYLSQHPQIYMCPLKEPHFFSSDLMYERGLEWYKGLYADAEPGQICGEASTSYTFWPISSKTARRLYETLPHFKIIYILREPVARVEAECLQMLKYSRYVLGDTSLPYSVDELLRYLRSEDNSTGLNPIETSEYIRHVEEYLKFFQREQLLVIFQKDLQDSTDKVMARIKEFLGLDPQVRVETGNHLNVTADFIRGVESEKFAETAKKVPGYQLTKGLLPKPVKEKIKSFLIGRRQDDDAVVFMSPETRRELTAHFKPYNDRLADFLDHPLSDWKSYDD
ncbi:MAG: sulfotransferase [Microcoleaceae cyanobacterium]